jgi:hypothetical protein
MEIREKIDGVIFSDIVETIFLWYMVIMLIIGVSVLIAMAVGYTIDESITQIIAICVLPLCLYLLYTLMVPMIGDFEE